MAGRRLILPSSDNIPALCRPRTSYPDGVAYLRAGTLPAGRMMVPCTSSMQRQVNCLALPAVPASSQHQNRVFSLTLTAGTLIRKLEGHTKAIRSLSFSHDSKTLITASEDMTMMIHDVSAASGNVATLTGHDSWVLSVAQSPAGGECVSGGSDKKVKVRAPVSLSRKLSATTARGRQCEVTRKCTPAQC